MKVFIALGYHMPQDFGVDLVYHDYLKFVADYIKKYELNNPDNKILLVFSGGNIDMDYPFDRVLSVELKKLFVDAYPAESKRWSIITEEKSLSSLENFVFCNELLKKYTVTGPICIFSEKTRMKRNRIIAGEVFNNFEIIPLELNVDMNGNQDKVVTAKEDVALKYSL